MTGFRRKARIVALQTLYEVDCSTHSPEDSLAHSMPERMLPKETVDFSKGLISGVLQNKQDIDDTILKFAPAFPIKQISIIDRNILRLAIFEILFDNKVPVKAVINEAVELAKSFGSDTSQKFINGVLGSIIANCMRQEESQKPVDGNKRA